MKNIGVSTLVNHNTFFAAFTLLALSRTSQQIKMLERLVAEDCALALAIQQVRQVERR
jgi:hypothetical protein